MNPNPGQRSARPGFMPTLMPMGSSMQQMPVITGSGGGLGSIFSPPTIGQPLTLAPVSLQSEHVPQSQSVVMAMQQVRPQRSLPKADLYRCKTSNNASEPPLEGEAENKKKVSLSELESSFKDLDSQQIKDTLGSFLSHIPGEFDRVPDTMLRQLLEQRTIGGKEFAPLSGQALLGFRLLPGPLPEMYRMDPPSMDSKPHHKKKKHKHKNIEKGEDSGELGSTPLTSKIKVPSDAYSFVKQDMSTMSPHITHTSSHIPSHPHTTYMSSGEVAVGGVIRQNQPAKDILKASNSFSPSIPIRSIHPVHVAPAPTQLHPDTRVPTYPGKKIKKPKKDKRKKEKGDKKKKKKHHMQDPPGPGPSSIVIPHNPNPYSQFSNP